MRMMIMILMIPNKTPSVILVLGNLIQKGYTEKSCWVSLSKERRGWLEYAVPGVVTVSSYPVACRTYVRTLRGPSLSLPAYIFVTILLVTPFTQKDEMRWCINNRNNNNNNNNNSIVTNRMTLPMTIVTSHDNSNILLPKNPINDTQQWQEDRCILFDRNIGSTTVFIVIRRCKNDIIKATAQNKKSTMTNNSRGTLLQRSGVFWEELWYYRYASPTNKQTTTTTTTTTQYATVDIQRANSHWTLLLWRRICTF